MPARYRLLDRVQPRCPLYLGEYRALGRHQASRLGRGRRCDGDRRRDGSGARSLESAARLDGKGTHAVLGVGVLAGWPQKGNRCEDTDIRPGGRRRQPRRKGQRHAHRRLAKGSGGTPIVMIGDGTYMMMNSDIYSSVLAGHKMIVVVCDNAGYAVINRLQIFKG